MRIDSHRLGRVRSVVASGVVFVFGVAVGIGGTLLARKVDALGQESRLSARTTDLWSVYRLWVDAGRPQGAQLRDFAERVRGPHCVLWEPTVVGPVQPHDTLFVDPDPDGPGRGTLSVTADGVVVWDKGKTTPGRKSLP